MGSPGGNNKGFLWMDKPEIPRPLKPPPPPDESRARLNEIARQRTERLLRASKGRAGAFMSLNSPQMGEPYRPYGAKTTTGG
jgi:hypothetical protein